MGDEHLHPYKPPNPFPLRPHLPSPSKHPQALQVTAAGKQARLAGVDGGVPGVPICGDRLGPGLWGGAGSGGAAGPHHLPKAAAAGLHPRHHHPQASRHAALVHDSSSSSTYSWFQLMQHLLMTQAQLHDAAGTTTLRQAVI